MLKGMTKHEDKEHGKTLKQETPRSSYHKATQNKNNTGGGGGARQLDIKRLAVIQHSIICSLFWCRPPKIVVVFSASIFPYSIHLIISTLTISYKLEHLLIVQNRSGLSVYIMTK